MKALHSHGKTFQVDFNHDFHCMEIYYRTELVGYVGHVPNPTDNTNLFTWTYNKSQVTANGICDTSHEVCDAETALSKCCEGIPHTPRFRIGNTSAHIPTPGKILRRLYDNL